MNSTLVTGDIVVDHHLYGGVKIDPASATTPGTVSVSTLGGAAFTSELLKAAADAPGSAWDVENERFEKLQKAAGITLPRPASLPVVRPSPSYPVHLGIDTSGLLSSLPGNLQSYGVWTPHPPERTAKPAAEKVWRAKTHFGYGAGTASAGIFKPAASTPPSPVILIDDGGICFRHDQEKTAWPNVAATSDGSPQPLVILKMAAPICRGDLWPHLLAQSGVADRLVVLVSAADLRREDVQIRHRLSWEQCALDTLHALRAHPIARQLLAAAHVVVNFNSAGALWLHRVLETTSEATSHEATLIYDATRLETDFSRGFDGKVYGFQTCVAASLAHHATLSNGDVRRLAAVIPEAIAAGLAARRALLRLGHGNISESCPGIPFAELGRIIAGKSSGFANAPVPSAPPGSHCQWSILADSESLAASESHAPHLGRAILTAKFGRHALATAPCLAKGALFIIDRAEIESLRALERLVREYEDGGPQKKPLSIGVFGPPGAGKSFGVKALANAILGEKVPVLEFNLSQFKNPDELIGAFHQVRDKAILGITPVVFWDEFDSQGYRWLQYLLAPMQDGAFQEGQITHPIGKCVFVFAGGTAHALEQFGPSDPDQPVRLSPEDRLALIGNARTDRLAAEQAWKEFRLLKGPDFISRLHGHLDVLGPNPREVSPAHCPDLTWPIRRALMLRGVLDLKEDPPETLDMDPGLLIALLSVPRYTHGSRSFEKILLTLRNDLARGHYHRSALPPDPLLNRETNAARFHEIMSQTDAFNTNPDIESIAAAIHEKFLDNARLHGWAVKSEVNQPYAKLSAGYQASNRAAALRIPDHLALIDFKVIPNPSPADHSWQPALKAKIAIHRNRLAEAEHLGWNAERFATGWTYAPKRDDALKQHPLLVPWTDLTESDKDKDRENMDAIPDWLAMAGYMAVQI